MPYVIADFLSETHRISCKVEVTATGLHGLLNDNNASALEARDVYVSRIQQPAKIIANFEVITLNKATLSLAIVLRREDVGPQSTARIHAAIDDAATLVWNGPLGAFELNPFDRGTVVAARHAAERTKAKKLISVAGGGDTVAALNQAHVAGQFTYVSTAGGAFLEWMEGKPLPGVEVLRTK